MEALIGDGIDMGNIVNSIKGVPDKKLFTTEPPADAIERKGVEAKDRTFLNDRKQRTVISQLLENRDDQSSLKTALKKLNTKGKNAVPRDDRLEAVHEVIKYCDAVATRVPCGIRELLYETALETPISALFLSNNNEAYGLLTEYLNEEIIVIKLAIMRKKTKKNKIVL